MVPVSFYFRAAALIFTYARCPTKSNVDFALKHRKGRGQIITGGGGRSRATL